MIKDEEAKAKLKMAFSYANDRGLRISIGERGIMGIAIRTYFNDRSPIYNPGI